MRKRGAQPGEENQNWRGGKHVASNGYIKIRVGVGHHLADSGGYAYEHRIVMEVKAGRKLTSHDLVHHIDGNKQNNTAENLELTTRKAHLCEHRGPNSKLRLPGQSNETIACACGCGTKLLKFDAGGRPRMYISGHNTSARNRLWSGCRRPASEATP